MPTEPDKSIEAQLKTWARMRRDDGSGPFELHPATRKLLQDEVARTFPKTPEHFESTRGWLTLLRPRLAFGLSVIAVMIGVGVALLPSHSRIKSRNEPVVASTGKKEPLDYQIERRNRVTGQQAEKPLPSTSRNGKNFDESPSAAPGLAVNSTTQLAEPTRSQLRADRLKETTKTDDARTKKVSVTSDLAQKRVDPEPVELALARKTKEAAVAKDESTLARREAAAENGPDRKLAEQLGLKPANAGGLGRTGAAAGARGPATAAATPSATPHLATPTDSRPENGRSFAAGDAIASTQTNQPVTTGVTSPAEARLVAVAKDNSFALNDQKNQRVKQPDTIDAAGEADRLQGADTRAFFGQSTGRAAQRFAQVVKYRPNFNSPPIPNVLISFQLEQNGRQVRIVDADGSVYDGATEPPAAEQVGKQIAAAQSAGKEAMKGGELKPGADGSVNDAAVNPGIESAPQQNLFFRVTGTNLTLNQLVVFQGNFLANANLTNAAVVGGGVNGVQANAPAQENQLLPTQQLLDTRIQGQAIIGGNDRVEINAVPASW